MGKLLLESYTKKGHKWLNKNTFDIVCNVMCSIVRQDIEQFVVVFTDLERKKDLLSGTEPSYGLSYVFKQGISDVKELETMDDLLSESKIIILDDLAINLEGLAKDNGRRIRRLFTSLLDLPNPPYQMGIMLQYYSIKDPKQLVLPIITNDLVYVVGDGLLVNTNSKQN